MEFTCLVSYHQNDTRGAECSSKAPPARYDRLLTQTRLCTVTRSSRNTPITLARLFRVRRKWVNNAKYLHTCGPSLCFRTAGETTNSRALLFERPFFGRLEPEAARSSLSPGHWSIPAEHNNTI